ncbi:hypothetical protein OG306_18690 [Streptomyces sp. NBC_01241]|uniref:hypothetical protein n=1 Tax=Streptomyces sp. NBC_01241 TaxID=2903794 RepID=UPI00352FB5D4|nr:hypothetical protein OG306_18690 [Streptomyces sp. NBC_01241]
MGSAIPSVTSSAEPSAIPTTTPSDGGSAAPAPAPPAPAPPSSPASGSASASPSGPPSAAANTKSPPREAQSPLAGREAGEGRLRPGRPLAPADSSSTEADEAEAPAEPVQPDAPDTPDTWPTATDPEPVPAAIPAASTSPEPGRLAPQALDRPAVQRVQRMSLGAGIALIGLGLGFLAIRMRRSA